MEAWIQPGILIAGFSVVLVVMGKTRSMIQAIKIEAIESNKISTTIEQMGQDIVLVKHEIDGVKKILMNGLNAKVQQTVEKVHDLDLAHTQLHETIKELNLSVAKLDTRCDERSKQYRGCAK
jgi:peptidoglycan hydrolase CwlO-like protein